MKKFFYIMESLNGKMEIGDYEDFKDIQNRIAEKYDNLYQTNNYQELFDEFQEFANAYCEALRKSKFSSNEKDCAHFEFSYLQEHFFNENYFSHLRKIQEFKKLNIRTIKIVKKPQIKNKIIKEFKQELTN